MVDVVVNDVMSTSITPDLSGYLFTEPDQYHPFCWVNFSSTVSEEECWLGDQNVPLPDLNTENPTVVAGFQSWVSNLVQEYSIDGLRIDGSFTLFFLFKKRTYTFLNFIAAKYFSPFSLFPRINN
jgi:alpha-amylase